MNIAIKGFLHFKVVNWVGIPMGWEQSDSIVFFKLVCLVWLKANGFKLDGRHLVVAIN